MTVQFSSTIMRWA